MSRNTVATIDLGAIEHNFRIVSRLAPSSKIASVVKADAYGHGIKRVAPALSASDLLAVATADEAAVLRAGGWSGRLLVLEGFANADDFELTQSLQTELVIHHPSQLHMLRQREMRRAPRFWLKLDSGMHRLGFPPADAGPVFRELASISGSGQVGLMTHFACADEAANPMTDEQIEAFDQAIEGLAAEQSLANSAGLLNFPRSQRDVVRPGILLYGISPDAGQPAAALGLRPAMTLSSELIAINQCRQGETVGYGATFRCPQDMRVGVAAIGYGDGYPRSLPDGAPVLVNGKAARLAGRVSMDMITLDLRGHDEAKTGDPVVLWGQGLSVESVAGWAGMLPYELICGVTGRVPRSTV
ncbi:MAG: alanine racemase [Lysobacterales bacterium]|jgi:alanine racemase